MKHLKYILFFILFHLSIQANTIVVDTYGDIENFNIEIFHSKNSTISLRQIINIKEFKTTTNALSLGYQKNPIWVKFKIKNNSKNKITKIISFSETILSSIDFYILDKNNKLIDTSYNGLKIDLKSRDIQNPIPAYKITLKPNEIKTIYIKMYSAYGLFGKFKIQTKESFFQTTNFQNYFYIFCFGIGTTIVLYNLFFFVYLREKIYLLYACYISSLFIPVLLYSGMFLYYFDEVQFHKSQITFPLIFFILILFTQDILKIKQKLTKMYKFLNLLKFLLLFSAIWITIDVQTGFYFANILSIIISITLLISGILSIKTENLTAKLYVLASSCFLTSMIVFDLLLLGVLPYNLFLRNIPFIGFIFEIILLSLAIVSRIPILKKEKLIANQRLLELKNEQNKILQDKVEKQTKDLKLLLHELQHRVKNNFQSILTFLWIQKKHLTYENSEEAFIMAYRRIYTMSFIHEMLYNTNNQEINFKEYIEKFIHLYIDDQHNTKVSIDITPVNLPNDIVNTLGMLLNELLSNSYKYAFKNIEKPTIIIKFYQENGYNVFYYKDNGIGFDPNIIKKHTGSGYKLIYAFIHKLPNSSINLLNDNGSICKITFRIEEDET